MRYSRCMNSNIIHSRLVAHRGDNEQFPENSLRGLGAALEAGARFVEWDIQLNAQHTAVLLHDASLKRTAGIDRLIFDCDDRDITRISVHEPARFGDRYAPEPLPLLEDALQLLSQFPDALAFVELKLESLNRFGLNTVMKTLLGSLLPYRAQVVLISFSAESIDWAQRNSPLATGWAIDQYNESSRQRAVQLKPDYLFCNYRKLSDRSLWQGDWQWVVYTINDAGLAKCWLKRSIDLVETDAYLRLTGRNDQ